jgi:transaldolase
MPEASLNRLATHQEFDEARPANNDDLFTEFAIADIDPDAVATQLLQEGIVSFAKSWRDLLACIELNGEALKAAVA